MKNQILGIALTMLTIMSCNTTKNTAGMNGNSNNKNLAQETITQEKWTLVKLEGQNINQDENIQPIYFNLDSAENRVNGFAGCNTFMGEYKLEEGNRIKFSKMATTRMACPDLNLNEGGVLKVFELADNYTINGDTLMLNVGRRAPLAVFVKSESQITEKYWKLKTLEGQEIEMADNQEKEAHFILKTEGNKVQGFAGCNSFSGNYTLEKGNRISFSQMATTLRACPDVDVNESEFLKIFELADNYTINNDILMLNIGRRAPLAVFEAVYFE